MRRRQRCGRSAVGAEPEHRRVDRVDDLLAGVRLQVIVREGLGNDFRPDRQIFSQRFQKLVNLGGSFSSGKKIIALNLQSVPKKSLQAGAKRSTGVLPNRIRLSLVK